KIVFPFRIARQRNLAVVFDDAGNHRRRVVPEHITALGIAAAQAHPATDGVFHHFGTAIGAITHGDLTSQSDLRRCAGALPRIWPNVLHKPRAGTPPANAFRSSTCPPTRSHATT